MEPRTNHLREPGQNIDGKEAIKKEIEGSSYFKMHREQIKGKLQPFLFKLSSVGSLSRINLHATRDLYGGISLIHIDLFQ